MLKYFQSLYRRIYRANTRTGFGIITAMARGVGRISPGLNRMLFGRYTAGFAGRKLMVRHSRWVVPGLTTALGGISFGLYHFLKDNREDLVREDNLSLPSPSDDRSAFSNLDRILLDSENFSRLKAALNSVSFRNPRTDIEAFGLFTELNDAYLTIFGSIADPKVLDFVTKHLLETTALYRQGLVYEHMNSAIQGNVLYTSYELDPTPQSNAEFLIAMEAACRSNTRLTSDLYE